MKGTKQGLSAALCIRLWRLTLIGALLLSNNLLYAQDAAQEPGQTEPVTLNFEKADIEGFIAAVSQVTGKSFIVDPRVKGKITVVSGSPLPPESIYQVFLSVLEVHNFSAVESGDFIKIVPTSVIKGTPTRTSFSDPGRRVDEQITQVYRLKYTSATELTPLLRPLLPATSHFAAHPTTNTIVITDTVANVRRILDIVENIDKPNRQRDIHIVFLENAEAENLATVISQLATAIEQQTDPGTLQGQGPGRVIVQAEPATNALIIHAPKAEFLMLKSVIDSLDIDTKPASGIHVLYLKHGNAAQIADILSGVVSDANQANATGQTAAKPLVSVRADEQSNALIVRAGPVEFTELQSVVDKLDIRRAQVYVELIIAEVTLGKEAEIGVEWQVNTSPGLDNQTAITREQTTGSTSFTSQTGGITLGFVNRFIFDLAGNLVPDLSAVLRALRSNNSTNILSTPNLLTLDNEPAEITVGQEVPFITGQFVSSATTGGTDGDGDGSPTGLVNPFQTIERKDVGLSLRITPQINDGDVIQLEIEQEVSNVSRTTLQGASDLVTDTRSIKTNVLVDDGQIIVLGGLIRDSLVDTYEYVPGLGSIPLLGALFRKKAKSNAKTNLMVFLRPKVIRSQQDMLGVTHGKYSHIKEEGARGQPDTRELIRGVKAPELPDIDWKTGEVMATFASEIPEVRSDSAGGDAEFQSGRR